VQQVCRSGQTGHERTNQFRYLEPPTARLALPRRRSAQFFNPSLLGFVLICPPDERSEAAMIVGCERNEAEGLQSIGDRAQHLCASEHCASSSQEYQFDLRSLDDGLRERKQTTGERNHLEVSPGGLAICKPKHGRIMAFEMSTRKTPRRAGLGRAAHIRHQYVAGVVTNRRLRKCWSGLVAGLGARPSLALHILKRGCVS
jgi:hypothetical protein